VTLRFLDVSSSSETAPGMGDSPHVHNNGRMSVEPTYREPRLVRWSRSRLVINLCRVAAVGVVLLTWQICASHGVVNKTFTSSPAQTWDALLAYYNSGQLLSSTASTMEAVLIAFVIGSVAGTVVGLILGLSPFLDEVLGVFLAPLNSIPRIALAPLFLLWFGLTVTAKVALAVTIVFFVLVYNARASVKSIDPDIVTMARVAGLRGRAFLTKILLPSSIPAVFAGLRLAITYSLLGVVASEMIAARNGVGLDIVQFSNTFNVGGVFAILFELSLIATVITVFINLLEKWLLRYQRT
jgi:NitT/TauT family transport system permease protein